MLLYIKQQKIFFFQFLLGKIRKIILVGTVCSNYVLKKMLRTSTVQRVQMGAKWVGKKSCQESFILPPPNSSGHVVFAKKTLIISLIMKLIVFTC